MIPCEQGWCDRLLREGLNVTPYVSLRALPFQTLKGGTAIWHFVQQHTIPIYLILQATAFTAFADAVFTPKKQAILFQYKRVFDRWRLMKWNDIEMAENMSTGKVYEMVRVAMAAWRYFAF